MNLKIWIEIFWNNVVNYRQDELPTPADVNKKEKKKKKNTSDVKWGYHHGKTLREKKGEIQKNETKRRSEESIPNVYYQKKNNIISVERGEWKIWKEDK